MTAAKLYMFRGEWLTCQEVANRLGVVISTVYKRRSGDCILDGDQLIDPFPDPHPRARMLTLRNRTMCIADWSRETGLSEKCIATRIANGWPLKYALSLPSNVGGFETITYQGRKMTLGRWAKESGMSPQTLRARLHRGWPVDRALTTPVRAQTSTTTGGPSQTFTPSRRTGGPSLAHHLQSEERA